jgi:hypothetical protein
MFPPADPFCILQLLQIGFNRRLDGAVALLTWNRKRQGSRMTQMSFAAIHPLTRAALSASGRYACKSPKLPGAIGADFSIAPAGMAPPLSAVAPRKRGSFEPLGAGRHVLIEIKWPFA